MFIVRINRYAFQSTAVAYGRLGGPELPSWKSALVEYFTELHGAVHDSGA